MKTVISRVCFLTVTFALLSFIMVSPTIAQGEGDEEIKTVSAQIAHNNSTVTFAVPAESLIADVELGRSQFIVSLPDDAELLVLGQYQGTSFGLIHFQREINFKLSDFILLYGASLGLDVSDVKIVERDERPFARAPYSERSSGAEGSLLATASGDSVFIALAGGGSQARNITGLIGNSFDFEAPSQRFLGTVEEISLAGVTLRIPTSDGIVLEGTGGTSLVINRVVEGGQEVLFSIQAQVMEERSATDFDQLVVRSLRSKGFSVSQVSESASTRVYRLERSLRGQVVEAVGYSYVSPQFSLLGVYPTVSSDPNSWLEARFFIDEIIQQIH